MALSTQPYKGARDFYPEDKRLQNYMFRKIRKTVELFGYEEYDAPILEPTELYLAKGNQEIIDEQTYTFKDRGDRSVTIRTEMTPTVSRMVAGRRQDLAYPVRWYSIPNLWRYERPQKGRLREFWQLNVDIFGVAGIEADHEIIMIANQVFKDLGAKPDMYEIKINSRRFIDYILAEYIGLDEVQRTSVVRLIDRMNKMERANFVVQLDAICSPSQREAGLVDKLLGILGAKRLKDLPEAIQAHPTAQPLVQVIRLLAETGVQNAVFDISLMRGFDYYTDIVFEVFDTDPTNNRAMCGGGRYDGLVATFGVEAIPTVGYAMGDATLEEFLRGHDLVPPLKSETDVYVILVGDVTKSSQKTIADLRNMGVNLAVDYSGKKIGDQMRVADKKGIDYVLIIGQKELDNGQFTLKNLRTGAEEKHGLERIVTIVEDYRRQPDEEEL
jgi:histidyl-tRNA synthetase